MNYGTIKNIGNGQVDVQLTGSAQVVRNVRISAQVGWNTLAIGTRVLVDTIEDKPVVLHTLTDVPHIYSTTEGQLVVTNPGATFPNNALLADGSVPLTGDLPVAPGVKVDGYDISVLGQTIDNLQAADSVARTGYTVMTHASHLVETIGSEDTLVKIRHDLFADKETLAVSNTMGQIEHMKVVGEAVPTVANDGSVCYLYTVTRRVATNPAGLVTGWAAATLVNGLTHKGYITFDAHDNLQAAPSMRFVLHTDIDANTKEQIVRVGSLVNVLGYTIEDYGFAIGRLSTADKYLSYSYTDNRFRIRGADMAVEDETGREVFRVWGVAEGGRVPGDYRAGPVTGGHQEWTSETGRLSFFSGANEVIYFSEAGSRFKNMVWAGDESGPQIGIGELDGEGLIVARNSEDVAQFVVRTQSQGVYVFAGNPKPQAGWMEFDNGLTVDGTIRARALEIIGQAKMADTGEIIIRDPADPRRHGYIKPNYLAGYSVDAKDTQYLGTLIAWGPTTLETVPGGGDWHTWNAGDSFQGDWRSSHFRVERDGRVGLFVGDTPKAWMDAAGDFHASGEVTALSGTIGGWLIGAATLTDQNGTIELSSTSGLNIKAGNSYAAFRSVNWLDEADRVIARLYGVRTSDNFLQLEATGRDENVAATVNLNAFAGAGNTGHVTINAYGNDAISSGAAVDVYSDGTTDTVGITANATKIGDGGATNYLEIGATGALTLVGSAKYERHVQLEAKVDGLVANQPTPVDFFTAGGLQFPTTGSKFAFSQWEIPDDWDGTNVYFEIDWFPDSAAISGTAAVRWTVEYRAIAEGELINQGTSVTLDNGAGGDTADYSQYQTKHTRMTLAFNNANQPLTAQDHIYFKISRDTSVTNDFSGSVTVTAYEVIYTSKGFPTSN